MSKVYEKLRLTVMELDAQDLVTTSLGYALGQDKSWSDNPWENGTDGGEIQ